MGAGHKGLRWWAPADADLLRVRGRGPGQSGRSGFVSKHYPHDTSESKRRNAPLSRYDSARYKQRQDPR